MSLKGNGGPVETSRDGNRLLDSLPPRQRTAVLAQCEHVDLAVDTVLCEAGEPFEYAYFPITGNISLLNAIVDHQSFETESIGRSGMLGATLILNISRAPQRGVVQAPCLALRMKVSKLRSASQGHPEFYRILQRYLYVVVLELVQTTGCIHFHEVGKRLARSLLQAHDHAQNDHLHLTHLLLADMLGVQRGAVTIAASQLQQQGIISYRRGEISILDRQRLEAKSCGCYGASIENYASLFS